MVKNGSKVLEPVENSWPKRVFHKVLVAALVVGLSEGVVRADVKTQEKSLVKFEGMLGRMMGMFGGKAAREGVVTNVAVQGSRKASLNDTTGQIVDLAEQKVYDVDMNRKTYKVTTFDELRRRMQEAQAKAREQAAQAAKSGEPGAVDPAKGDKEFEIDFSVRESGQRRSIAGYDAREVVMTVTVREKGKKLEESGGMVLTANSWLAPRIAAMKEVADFDLKYMKALGYDMALGSAEQMATALAMYPGLKEALGRFQNENVNMDGTAVLSTVTIEAVASPQQAQAEAKEERPGGVGGLIGGLGRRLAKKKEDPAQNTGRRTFMTMTHEVLSVSTSVGATDTAIPAGFRETK